MSGRKTAKESAPLNDVAGLARHVPEVDPAGYFDEQARQAYEEALVKWPLLARLMGLGAEGAHGDANATALTRSPASP